MLTQHCLQLTGVTVTELPQQGSDPIVEGAYTPANTFFIPPLQTTARHPDAPCSGLVSQVTDVVQVLIREGGRGVRRRRSAVVRDD